MISRVAIDFPALQVVTASVPAALRCRFDKFHKSDRGGNQHSPLSFGRVNPQSLHDQHIHLHYLSSRARQKQEGPQREGPLIRSRVDLISARHAGTATARAEAALAEIQVQEGFRERFQIIRMLRGVEVVWREVAGGEFQRTVCLHLKANVTVFQREPAGERECVHFERKATTLPYRRIRENRPEDLFPPANSLRPPSL